MSPVVYFWTLDDPLQDCTVVGQHAAIRFLLAEDVKPAQMFKESVLNMARIVWAAQGFAYE